MCFARTISAAGRVIESGAVAASRRPGCKAPAEYSGVRPAMIHALAADAAEDQVPHGARTSRRMSRYFHVYKAGRLTVIGFEGRHLADPRCQVECREELLRVVNAHACEVLVVDLMDVD